MGFLQDYVSKLEEDQTKKTVKACNDAIEEFLLQFIKKMKVEYKKAIDNFYNGYDRKMYNPRGTLYKDSFFEIGVIGTAVYTEFHPEVFPARDGYTSEKDGIYVTVFKEGWHGGANKYGGMKYPVGRFKKDETPRYYDGEYRPYDDVRYLWTPATKASISPYNDFLNRWNYYQDYEFDDDLNKILQKHLDKIE